MKTKSLGELLSDAEDRVYGAQPSMWRVLSPGVKKEYQRVARIFVRSLPAGELTSPAIASKAAKALRSKKTSKAGKSIAASALTQARRGAPRCKCGEPCQLYGGIGGYSVQCQGCNEAQGVKRRAASARRRAGK